MVSYKRGADEGLRIKTYTSATSVGTETQFRPEFRGEVQQKIRNLGSDKTQIRDELISKFQRLNAQVAIPGKATRPMMSQFRMFP